MKGPTGPPLRVVIDSNILLSALLRDGLTRHAIVVTRHRLVAPSRLREEVARVRRRLGTRMQISGADFDLALDLLLTKVEFVPAAQMLANWHEAESLIARRDPNDVPYVAAALAIDADLIWSRDADFDVQRRFPRVEWLPL